MSIVVGYDTIGANVGSLPAGAQVAGYDTGSGIVPWSAAEFAAHPGAVHIDQDPGAVDSTADVLDVENGAATVADCPGWVKRAQAAFNAGKRPGQRWPAIYASASNLTPVCNALIAGGVTSGVGLWVAHWGISQSAALAMLTSAGGPFPVIGVQFADPGPYDVDLWAGDWLARVSGSTGPFPHTTDGKTSLGQYAADRSMVIYPWLAEQYRLHPDDANNLAAAAVPPAGMRWWSIQP